MPTDAESVVVRSPEIEDSMLYGSDSAIKGRVVELGSF